MPTHWIGSILALLTAAAGWYYLFYSKAAARLADLEQDRANRRRIRLRRVGGAVMLLMGLGLYLGFEAANPDARPITFVVIWTGVMALICMLIVLALIDIRLTLKLRHSKRPGPPPSTDLHSDSFPHG